MTPERWRQVDRLYHSALEREPGERAAFLGQACQGDEELRREVEELLAQDSSSGNILERPAADLLADSTVTQLTAGTELGPYKIEALLGAGGMGEVYRAVDTRLDRAVAIKISAQRFSTRFEREARAIAKLNHPNICTLYDVGPNYLVMELIEGKPLKGPLALDQALRYAAQICDALDAAHRKTITHRDLKPGNILVTKQGIKLLDFGLARMAPGESDPTLTHAGDVMGTPAYMSPEQREGKPGDARSDIYAFGCVLYEMLRGKRVAQERTPVEPAALENVLRGCLEKDPDDRWQSARDIKRALALPAPAPPVRAGFNKLLLAVVAALALALIVLSALFWPFWRATRPADRPMVRLDVDLGLDLSPGPPNGANVIISPDGTRLVYVSHNRLLTRPLDQPQATELPGTEGAYGPFFSPDGQWVAFFAGNNLKKVSVAGGAAAITLCNASIGFGGSWGEDSTIIAALANTGGLSRILAEGGAPAPLTELDRDHGDLTHRWPRILPGGKAVLFTAHTRTAGGFDDASINVMSLGDRRTKTLLRGGFFGRYLATSKGAGQLIYVNRGTLFAVPFDLGSLEVRGVPTPILNQVAYSVTTGAAKFEASQTGTLVYESGEAEGGSVSVRWLEKDGTTRPLVPKPGDYGRLSLSPDGRRLAMEVFDGASQDIWVYDSERSTMTRMTFDGKVNQLPIWSPDGRYIVFSDQGGLSWTRSDGAGKPQSPIRARDALFAWSFAPDGKRLAYFDLDPRTAFDLWTVPLESDSAGLRARKPEVFLQTPFDERYPTFSPDERWLAYGSTESGSFQVYVRAFPDRGAKWQISSAGGAYPMWSRSGRELFFESLDNRIMVAGYTVQGDSFVADKPRLWSDKALANLVNNSKNVDLAPDGKRVVAVLPAEGPEAQRSQNHVVFLENFFDELRRRVPAGK